MFSILGILFTFLAPVQLSAETPGLKKTLLASSTRKNEKLRYLEPIRLNQGRVALKIVYRYSTVKPGIKPARFAGSVNSDAYTICPGTNPVLYELANDTGVDPTSVTFPASGSKNLIIPQGFLTIDPATGDIGFTVSAFASGTFSIQYAANFTSGGSGSTTISFTIIPAPTAFTVTGGGTYCAGSPLPHIGLSGSQVTFQYQLQLNGTNTGGLVAGTGSALDFGPQPAGNYTVKAISSQCDKAMSSSATVTVANISFTATPTNPTCNTGSGSINITGTTGGTGPYSYSANNGTTFPFPASITGLAGGTYQVMAKDANGCKSSAVPVTITLPPAVTFTSTTTPAVCNGGTGSVSLTASGGSGTGYTYSNGGAYQVSGTFSGLTPGTAYTFTAKDGSGCVSAPQTITITPTPAVTFTSVTTSATCSGGTGSISLTASGGSGTGYTYSNGGAYQVSGTFNGLTPGTAYTFTAKDGLGCISSPQTITIAPTPVVTFTSTSTPAVCNGGTGSITLTGSGGSGSGYQYSSGGAYQTLNTFSPLTPGTAYTFRAKDGLGCISAPQTITIAPTPAVTFTSTQTNAICNGGTGSVSMSASGGSGTGFKYSVGGAYQNSGIFPNLVPGTTYTLSAMDGSGCTSAPQTVVLTQPAPLSFTTASVNAVCQGAHGSISVTAAGGTGSYQYSSDGGATWQSMSSFSLTAGTYHIALKDNGPCTVPANQTVSINEPTALTFSFAQTNVSCNGAGDGSFIITASGASGSYVYSIDNGVHTQTSSTFSGLAPGAYTLLVKDNLGCTAPSQPATITQPGVLGFTASGVDVLCHSASTGTISFTVNGGTGPYFYSVNNGSSYTTVSPVTGLAAGNYTLLVKDSHNCFTGNQSLTIHENPALTISAVSSSTKCSTGNTGSITITAGGGVGPYNYSSDGSTYGPGNVISFLAPGSYTVYIKDSKGCIASTSATVGQASPITFTASETDALCFGSYTGTITLTASGGTGAGTYQYSDDNGHTFSTSNVFTALQQGTYTLLVTDANGCSANSQTITVAQPAVVSFTTSAHDALCNGTATGTIAVTAIGGNGSYLFSKDNGSTWQSSSLFAGLAKGTYLIKARDGNLCTTGNQSVTINEPQVLAFTTGQSNVSCRGGSDGSITAQATAGTGTAPYTYSIDGVTFSASGLFTGLTSNSYTITVKDANGCTQSTSVYISQPTLLSYTATPASALCNGASNGTITFNAAGGTSPWFYSINNGSTWQSSPFFSNLSLGSYSVLVKDSKNCIAPGQNISVGEPAALSFTYTSADALCSGTASGSITITATGGVGPYQYSDDDGLSFHAGNTFPNLSMGTYKVRVMDLNLCQTVSQSVVISQPAPFTFSVSKTDASCNGSANGAIVITAGGGTPPYVYSKDNGSSYQGSASYSSLASGTYQVLVKDHNSCLATEQDVVIGQPVAISITVSQTNVSCKGGTNGKLSISAGGGTGVYTYSINGGISYSGSPSFSGLSAGTYPVIAVSGGCTSSTLNVVISEPTTLSFSFSKTDNTCNGASAGSIDISATGGTGPYNYSIDNGSTWQSASHFANLASGTYSLLVQDAGLCTSAMQQLTLVDPAAIVLSISQTDVICNSTPTGSITASATGGTGTIVYSDDNGATFQGSGFFPGLLPGTYQVVAKDATACLGAGVSVTIHQTTAVTYTVTKTDATCNASPDGTITFHASGGTLPYSYSIDGGANYVLGPNFTGLPAGQYHLIMKDGNSCLPPAQTILISQPGSLTLAVSNTDATCNGGTNGSVTATAGGGTAPYSYSIDHGSSYQLPNLFSNLPAGSYDISVKDANGCTVGPVTATVSQPAAIIIISSQVQPSCYGQSNGSLSLSASGGTGAFTYSLDNSVYTATSTFANLAAGNHLAGVSDASGCIVTQNVVLAQPALLSFSMVAQNPACATGNTGSITVTASGGTPPYQYSLNGGSYQSSPIFSGLVSGSYTIGVIDAACTASPQGITLSDPPALSFIYSSGSIACAGSSTGTVHFSASGGTGAYSYSVDNGLHTQTSANFTNLAQGSYQLVVLDAAGCKSPVQTLVLNDPPVLAFTGTTTSALCKGSATGKIVLTGSGGTAPYQYSIDNGVHYFSGNTFNNLAAGNYKASVMDSKLCTAPVQTLVVGEPSAITFTWTHTDAPCYNTPSGSITITASGGSPSYQYSVDGGTSFHTSNFFPGLMAGSYNLVVQDANGCLTAAATQVIGQASQIIFSTSSVQVLCHGASSGSITVSASGGTGTLQYSMDNGHTFQGSNVFSALAAGTYQIVVSDQNLCQPLAQTVVITEPAGLYFSQSHTDELCNGASTGTISLSAGGGTPPYQYSIDNGLSWSTNPNFSGLFSANYILVVKDAAGCTSTQSVNIKQPSGITFTYNESAVKCQGGSTGVITITATGGTGSYLYSIDNGAHYASGNTFAGLPALTYKVRVQDANLCQTPSTLVTVSEPAILTFTSSSTPASCFGSADGTITLTASGGTSPYKYSTDGLNFYTGNILHAKAAGAYTITVQDANGCQTSGTANVSQPSQVSFSYVITQVSCNSAGNGSITMTGVGGSGTGYQYSIDNGTTYTTSATYGNLVPGTYNLLAKDGASCTSIPQQATVTEPPVLAFSFTKTNVKCFGDANGTITFTATGGTPPYSYSVSNGLSYENTSTTIAGLGVASYQIKVKDANGCSTVSQSANIGQPAVLGFYTLVTAASCKGNSDGIINVYPTGGTGPFTFSIDGTHYQSSSVFSGLAVGTYPIQVQDANACITPVQSTFVGEPALLTLSSSHTDASCYNSSTGTITLTAAGGTAPYRYSVNGGGLQTSSLFSALATGVYTIQTQDAHGCTATAPNVNIGQPSQLVYTSSKTDAVCYGSTSGNITFAASGGSPPYQYSTDGAAHWQTSNSFAVGMGSYTLQVQDSKACLSAISTVVINQPSAIVTSTSQINELCKGSTNASINVSATGGKPGYQYSIDNGAHWQLSGSFTGLTPKTYLVLVKDLSGCTPAPQPVVITEPAQVAFSFATQNITCKNASDGKVTITASGGSGSYLYSVDAVPYQTNQVFTGLAPGSHTAWARDVNGCTAPSQPFSLSEPSVLVFTQSHTDVSCHGVNDGTITFTASGGTPPYKYSVDNGITYVSNATVISLAGGSYTVQVKDNNNCVTGTQPVTIIDPVILSQSTAFTNPSCNGSSTGSITLTQSGGTAPWVFSINAGTSYQATGSFTSLAAGTYTCQIKDSHNCLSSQATLTLVDPALLALTVSSTSESCSSGNDATITLLASGGSPAYRYSIDNGLHFQPNGNFSGLNTATYQVLVQDSKLCTTVAVPVTITRPSAITMTLNYTAPLCHGGVDGTASLSATGGTPPYTYSLDGLHYGAMSSFSNLPDGLSYTAVVKDAKGCSSLPQSFTLNAPAALTLAYAFQNVSCVGASDGSMTLTAGGGTAPWSYSIDGGATYLPGHPVFTGLAPAVYNLYVKDANGCTGTAGQVTLTEPGALVYTAVSKDISCHGAGDGSIIFTASGGTAPYQYSTDGGSTFTAVHPAFTGLSGATYSLQVKDAHGCRASIQSVTIHDPSLVQLTLSHTDPFCNGAANGAANLSASGGTPPYSFTIDGIHYQSNGNFSNLIAGNYSAQVKDNNACTTASQNFTLMAPGMLSFSENLVDLSCKGAADGKITFTASGGTAPYSYSIDGGSSYQPAQPVYSGLAAASYSLIVKDAAGCSATLVQVTLHEPTVPGFTATETDITCHGASDGKLSFVAQGGTAPYSYSIDGGSTYLPGHPAFTNLAAGVYQLLVKDQHGCTSNSQPITVKEPAVLGFTFAKTDVSCKNASNGSITFTVTGGTASYSYSLDGSAYTAAASNKGLAPGMYTLSVKDQNGCQAAAQNIQIIEPGVLVATSQVTGTTCSNKNDGSIMLSASGGTAPYQYSLDNGLHVQPSGSFNGLAAGSYSYLVSDGGKCSLNGTLVVSSPAALSLSTNVQNSTCQADANGTATVNAIGGSPGYTYLWSTSPVQKTTTATKLLGGTYSVTVSDASGCAQTAVVTVGTNTPVSVAGSSLKTTLNTQASLNLFALTKAGTMPPDPASGDLDLSSSGIQNTLALAGKGTFSVNPSGLLSFTPFTGFTGSFSIAFSFSDAGGCVSAPASLQVSVDPLILPPVTSPDSYSIVQNKPYQGVTVLNNDTDPQGLGLSATLSGAAPAHGTVVMASDGSFLYTPTGIYSGKDQFMYTACNTAGKCAAPTLVSLSLAILPLPPVAGPVSVEANPGKPVQIPVLANASDPQNSPLHVVIIDQAAHGTLLLGSDQTVTYTAASNFLGTDYFSYQVCDSYVPAACSNISTVTVSVVKPNTPADLQITETAAQIVTNDTYSYTLSIHNNGPNAATQVLVTDTLTAGLTYVSGTPDDGIFTYDAPSNSVSWSVKGLGSGSSLKATLIVHTSAMGSIFNQSRITAYEPDPVLLNNLSAVTVTKTTGNLLIPTLFTPDGNGENDLFVVKNLELFPDNEMEIFNRWGNQVYHATGYMQSGHVWDGSNLAEGTYYYVLKVNMFGLNRIFSGYTTIVRGRK